MKVLVIDLLRLGDFLQIVPVLQALKTQYAIRELDVLVHKPVAQLAPMVSVVDHWHTLDRDELQAGLGRADLPLLTSFAVLREQLDELNHQRYDCVINLTQTVFSGWIAGYVSAPQRYGLAFDVKGQAQFHSSWFQYLDDHAPLDVPDIFHYTDIFYYGCGLKGGERQWNLRVTRHGRAEVAALGLGEGEKIVLQTLTSDIKKTWPRARWLETLRQLRLFRPHAELIALGAPSEERAIDELVQEGLGLRKAILSLEGAHALLSEARLLITGDTSIKHLAVAGAVPILELSLGSSDYRRTGAYRANSLILQAQVPCAPCPHSSPCSRARHDCAERLSPDLVSLAAHQFLDGNWAALRELAYEYRQEARLLRTRSLASGFWWAADLNETAPERAMETILERCTWKLLLSREHLHPLAPFGSEGVHMRRELETMYPGVTWAPHAEHLNFLEDQAGTMGERAAALLSSVRRREPQVDDIKNFLIRYQPQSSALTWLETLPEDPVGTVGIAGLRRMQNQLEGFYQRSQVKMKLIRSLKFQLMESK